MFDSAFTEYGEKDLFLAIKSGNLQEAKKHLKDGANVNKCWVILNANKNVGLKLFPVDIVLDNRDVLMLRLLMNYGLDISKKYEIYQIAFLAIWNSKGTMIETNLLAALDTRGTDKEKVLQLIKMIMTEEKDES